VVVVEVDLAHLLVLEATVEVVMEILRVMQDQQTRAVAAVVASAAAQVEMEVLEL
jgi:hypothetical protein